MYQVVSFDDFSLNDANYRCRVVGMHNLASSNNSFVSIPNGYPKSAGTHTLEVRTIALDVRLRNYENRFALIQAFQDALAPGKDGLLVESFAGEDYQIACQVAELTQDQSDPVRFTVLLDCGNSLWRSVSPEMDGWTVTASGQTKTVNVGGHCNTRLCLEITPTNSPVSGWLYQDLYQLVNVPGVNYGRRAWCITLDTATLVAAGKLRADCFDLRIAIGGQQVPRWIADPNTDHTKVWFVVDINLGYSLKLKTAVASSGDIGELSFVVDKNTQSVLKALPASGILFHGSEWLQYSGTDTKSCRVNIVSSRGALGTAPQAHSAGDTFKYIQNVIHVLMGNSAATDPAIGDDDYDLEKPMFDLSLSDNGKWVYNADSGFYDPAHPNRPGSWTPVLTTTGKLSEAYQISKDAESGDPVLGMVMRCWQKIGRWQNESATVAWMLSSASGFDRVSAPGQKMRNTARWMSTAGLQKSVDGKKWVSVWNEQTPLSLNTWTAVNKVDQVTSLTPRFVRFVISGSLTALADAEAYFEIFASEVVFTSANLPAGSLLGQNDNYPLAVTISNLTTGESMTVAYPMRLNQSFTIDGENYRAHYGSTPAHNALLLNDESREVWLSLKQGANTLQITAEEMGILEIDLSWYPRMR